MDLMNKDIPKEYQANKAMVQYVAAFIGLMVVILIVVQAVLPTIQTAIDDGNFTGSTGTLLGLLPLLIAVVLVLMVVSLMR
jgi:uncharacterized membrane protein